MRVELTTARPRPTSGREADATRRPCIQVVAVEPSAEPPPRLELGTYGLGTAGDSEQSRAANAFRGPRVGNREIAVAFLDALDAGGAPLDLREQLADLTFDLGEDLVRLAREVKAGGGTHGDARSSPRHRHQNVMSALQKQGSSSSHEWRANTTRVSVPPMRSRDQSSSISTTRSSPSRTLKAAIVALTAT